MKEYHQSSPIGIPYTQLLTLCQSAVPFFYIRIERDGYRISAIRLLKNKYCRSLLFRTIRFINTALRVQNTKMNAVTA
jgi:hypothetical protein